MRSLLRLTTRLPIILLVAIVGCASSEPEDELLNESAVDPQVITVNDSYFAIMSDLRRCSYPTCGGWVLQRLNRTTTQCHDGRSASTCYTPVLDWSQSNLPEAQRAELLDQCNEYAGSPGVYAIVRGTFKRFNLTTPRPELGRFVIKEAWLAEGETVSAGTFVNVKDNGIRCFAAPCPSFTETALNLNTATNIADVDFVPAELTQGQVDECRQLMATPIGVIVAGNRYTVNVDGRTADGRTATAAFYPLMP